MRYYRPFHFLLVQPKMTAFCCAGFYQILPITTVATLTIYKPCEMLNTYFEADHCLPNLSYNAASNCSCNGTCVCAKLFPHEHKWRVSCQIALLCYALLALFISIVDFSVTNSRANINEKYPTNTAIIGVLLVDKASKTRTT